MSLVVGENSWASLAEAEAYLLYKLNSGDWKSLPEDSDNPGVESQTLFLVTAFNILLNKKGYELTATLTDTNVKDAQIELAFSLFKGTFLSEDELYRLTMGVKSFSLSKWSETYVGNWEGDFPLPYMVENFLSSYRRDNMTVSLDRDD